MDRPLIFSFIFTATLAGFVQLLLILYLVECCAKEILILQWGFTYWESVLPLGDKVKIKNKNIGPEFLDLSS